MYERLRQLDGATNVLLAESSIGDNRDFVTSLLRRYQSTPNVLFVTYTRPASAYIDQLDEGEPPENAAVISVGNETPDITDENVLTESVSSANDLTCLGIRMDQFLSRWGDSTLVYFDSLTPMLQYVTLRTAYEFVHTITGRIYSNDGKSYFRIIPDAHDEREIAAFASLFDAKLSPGEEPPVQRRNLPEPLD